MLLLSLITIILSTTTGVYLMSIPVFGTKRYHRSSLPSATVPQRLPTQSNLINPSLPYYNQLSTYYDTQPMSTSLSSYGSSPIISTSNLGGGKMQNYQNGGYLTENGYYYYPRHEYHLYGMPTYHGEYKPKPYYYAPAPRYSYYDDHDIESNPMDDLHEEILHEDERERQRELQPYGHESWYQANNNNNNNNNINMGIDRQDELTNNFLKNLIEYNRQIDAQQKLQQQQQDELLQRDEEHKMRLRLQQQQQQQQQLEQQQQQYGDEYDEYIELNDYDYEPQQQMSQQQNINDLKKDESQQQHQQYYQQKEPSSKYYFQSKQQLSHPTNRPNVVVVDDEDVRQLKSLANQATIQNMKNSKNNINNNNNHNDKTNENDRHDNFDLYSSNSWKQPQLQQELPIPSKSFAQYDNEPEEYDDDAWISWDRKRSPSDNLKWNKPLKKIEFIKAFNNRKPEILVDNIKDVKDLKKLKDLTATMKSNHKEIPSSSSTTKSTSTAIKSKSTLSTTTPMTLSDPVVVESSSTQLSTEAPNSKFSGQKEVVLPRPAGPAHLFFIDDEKTRFDSLNLFKDDDDDDDDDDGNDGKSGISSINGMSKNKIENGDDSKRNAKETIKSDNVYDTIKQLITMEHQLEKTPLTSRVQKRYVTNEETLVKELNNLKRTST